MFSARAASFALFSVLAVAACGGPGQVRQSAPGENPEVAREEARAELRTVARDSLAELYSRQPSTRSLVEGAAGYAVFSNLSTKLMITGGGSGRGVAVQRSGGREVFMRMAEFQAGLGFGVKKFRLIWVFQTQAALDQFINSGYEFGGQGAVAAQMGATGTATSGALSVSPGVWLFQITDDGLAAELTVKGTKYYKDRELN